MHPALDPSGEPDGLLELFLRLAAVPSPSGSERAVADLVTAELTAAGLEVVEDDAAAAVGGECGNLVVDVRGRGEGTPILIAAHLDTVAVSGEIVPVVEGGVVRSAGETILGADDKAAVAALVLTLCELARRPPACGVEAVFTVAEEVGLRGAAALDVGRFRARAGFVFDTAGPVGEVVVRAPVQKTVAAVFRGVAAHAGIAPEKGRSAVLAAARAVAAMDLGRLDDETTANVGRIEGGVATNIVPDRCELVAEVRGHDAARVAESVAAMIEALQTGAALSGVDVEVSVGEAFAAFALSETDLPVRIAGAALRAAGIDPRPAGGGGGSDANVFNARGLPSVNLSVGMEDVHSPAESMPVARLHEARRVMRALVDAAAVTAA